MSNSAGKRVAIGIATKNCEATVREAVCSIERQTYSHELMSIVIVDGNSSDKTLSIVSQVLSRADIPWEIHSDKGKGLGAARQIVIDNIHADYLVWVDADVTIPEDYVMSLVESMEQDPSLGGVRAMQGISDQTSLMGRVENLSLLLRKSPGHVFDGHGILRINAAREVGGFDQNIKGAGEDVDLIIRMMRAGWVFSVGKAKFYHSLGSWKQVWAKRIRAGYGIHYVNHKHKGLIHVWHQTLPVLSFVGLRDSAESYKSTHQKASFLLPFIYVLKSIGWWVGYARGHMDDYGHFRHVHEREFSVHGDSRPSLTLISALCIFLASIHVAEGREALIRLIRRCGVEDA